MKEDNKGSPAQTFNRPIIKADPDIRHSNPVDPNEKKEMLNISNPHHEELMDQNPK